MGWLAQHLEEFVRPVLGHVPELPVDHKRFFVPQEMSVIKNMWKVAKCEARRLNKPLLLAGRDVYAFEVLARREGYPTTFRPDISRMTVGHVKEDYSGHFLFDTGFMGSIARGLRITDYTMASSNKASYGPVVGRSRHIPLLEDVNQAFPRLTGARSLALKIERTPKYWRTGFYRDPEATLPGWTCKDPDCTVCLERGVIASSTAIGIGQEFSPPEEFLRAALLTIEIYKDSSPAFAVGQLQKTRVGHTDW